MVNQTYFASGQVIDRKSKQGVAKLHVEACDKDRKYNDFLGVAVTDREGRFTISFDETYFREYTPDTAPDLFFKVYYGKQLLKSTEDSVIWNAKTRTDVTIEVAMPLTPSLGKDRITAKQVFKGLDIMQKSDFSGLWGEVRSKTVTTFGFVTDMVMNTITNMDIEPIKVGKHKTGDVINQDVNSARKHLEAQKVIVNEVKPYKPGLNAESLADIAAFPVRLEPGQKVNLYEEDGKVRYYSIVKVKAATEVEMTDSLKAQQAELNKLKKELKTTRQSSLEKDQQMASLQQEVESLRKEQNEIKKYVSPETFAQMEQNIKKLQEFKTNTEKTQKKSPN